MYNNWNENKRDSRVKEVYELCKSGQLFDALSLIRSVMESTTVGDYENKAYAWVLINLCKKSIAEHDFPKALEYYNVLKELNFESEDNFTEIIYNQVERLSALEDQQYELIKQTVEKSKNGQEKDALMIMSRLNESGQLSEKFHEEYGWIIYRFLKNHINELSSKDVRSYLFEYMKLKNTRPSILHSMILNIALNFSKGHSEFIFYNFLVMWDMTNLTWEDLRDVNKEGKNYPSLVSRICRHLVDNNQDENIKDFVEQIKDRCDVMDMLREPYFWKIWAAYKDGNLSEMWSLFESYNRKYAGYGPSKWHSEILNLAVRLMVGNESWRFLNFFKNWGSGFREEDWYETKGENDAVYKPIAIKALRHCFDVLKVKSEKDIVLINFLSFLYEKALKCFPDDEWLKRQQTFLIVWSGDYDLAIESYRKLCLVLGDKYYVWKEFADCIQNDDSLKIGMYYKALSLENNEDYLGEIHLSLAALLVRVGKIGNAADELRKYKLHKDSTGNKVSYVYSELRNSVCSLEDVVVDEDFIRYSIERTEEFAYDNLPWQEVVLVEKWRDEKEKEHASFSDGNQFSFQTALHRFPFLKNEKLGGIFKVKYYDNKSIKRISAGLFQERVVVEHKYTPLLLKKIEKAAWSLFPLEYGYVDYVNIEKKVLHIISAENLEFPTHYNKQQFHRGQFVIFRHYDKEVKGESRHIAVDIQLCDKETAVTKFKSRIVAVDEVNASKELFHIVLGPNLISCIVHFDETTLRPKIGTLLKLHFCIRIDKEKRKKLVPIYLEETSESNGSLVKIVEGVLTIHRNSVDEAVYAFVEDCYVPRCILLKYGIVEDCCVEAKVVCSEDGKWKVFEINFK